MCRPADHEEANGTQIFNAYSKYMEERARTVIENPTFAPTEAKCIYHYHYHKYICLKCLTLLCVQCHGYIGSYHKLRETQYLFYDANKLLKANREEIKEISDKLQNMIRETRMKMKTTKWLKDHRMHWILSNSQNYDEEYFEEILAWENIRKTRLKTKQKKHLEDLISAQQFYVRIYKRDYIIWKRLEALCLPEMKENFKKLVKEHKEICPPVRNDLLRGLTIRTRGESRTHKIITGGEDSLNRPWGICCDKDGQIFVSDRSNHQIKVFNREGQLIKKFGSRGSGPLQFETPAGIAVHPNGNIVIVDKGNNRIKMHDPAGNFIRSFGENLDHPMDIACSSIHEIVVTNENDKSVHMYSTYGQLLRKSSALLRCPDSSTTTITPRGICCTPNNEIVITDFQKNSIVVLDRSLTKVLYEFSPKVEDHVEKMQSITCDQFGNFVTVDKHNKVCIFNFDGRKRIIFGGTGTGEIQFQNPTGVCLLPDSSICISESGNNRIHIIT